jgi:DNA-binding response OmpR family regulator
MRALRVLVADDEPDQVLTLSTYLRYEGYEVQGVHDGRAVLAADSRFKPDVAVLDINMPGLSGFDVARELRLRHGHDGIVLIAMTVWKKEADRLMARAAGFNHHFGKPFDPRALLEVLAGITPKGA